MNETKEEQSNDSTWNIGDKMTKETKHTELPLPFEMMFDGEKTHIVGHNGTPFIATIHNDKFLPYILKACNNFEAMKELLQMITKQFPIGKIQSSSAVDTILGFLIPQIKKLLSQLEEGE